MTPEPIGNNVTGVNQSLLISRVCFRIWTTFLSGARPGTDEILSMSVSILTGAASPVITVKVERSSETHKPLCIASLLM